MLGRSAVVLVVTTNQIHDYLRNPDKVDLHYFAYKVTEDLSDLAGVLIYDLQGRIDRQRKPLIKDGLSWTYDAMRVFVGAHPYASEAGIRKAFLVLETAGLIKIEKTGKYNRKGFDKKWWYHVTPEGMRRARLRLIRFEPNVAVELKIPKAVLLQTFRYRLKKAADEYVALDPAKLGIPYSVKTINRHLDELVQAGILERHPDDPKQYCIPARAAEKVDWRQQKQPITVAPSTLLPTLVNGEIGLLVGHSGTGKTSFSTFAAVQLALAGSKVLYVSLEEPIGNIVNRMYAQEFGVSYSALHQGDDGTFADVEAQMSNPSERQRLLARNLRLVDLSGQHSQTHEILDEIIQEQQMGFAPDVVMIDQLEFIGVEHDEVESEDAGVAGAAVAPAILLHDSLGERAFQTWVLHQVNGACEWTFPVREISGGQEVVYHFDCVIGIGRPAKESPQLRLFSMTDGIRFEQILDADFLHMRFLPHN